MSGRISTAWLLLIVGLAGISFRPVASQEKAGAAAPAQTAAADSVDRDYSAELPRLPPQEPADALKTFTVANGFQIQQVCAEPLVTDPIAVAFDENLRMFVVEMRGYSENRDEKLSRIRLLEDVDGDGVYDRGKIFVDQLKWPTAVCCWNGGILVADAPDLHWYKDTDGDGLANEHKILFTGFGVGNVQGLVNSFNWGLDNRIYGSSSSSGGELTKPSDPAVPPLPLRGRDFAIEPRGMTLAATSGGAQHGLSMNDWGDRFVCHNSDHIQQIMVEDHYLARNPYLAAPSPRASIAADGPQADVFRTSPVEPWRIVRTRLRVKGIIPGGVEGGGRAAGYFTSATGITIYRGDAWPAEYQGLAIVGDVGSNIIHRKRLSENGLEYIARRIDEKSEFVSSTDTWFRPVQFANAPDGSLLFCDMYRETIEHPASLHPAIKKHLDLTSGRDRGRIYRIVPMGFQQPKLEKLGGKTTAELVALLAHPNGWQRDTAARLLYQRQDRKSLPLLEKLAAESPSPQGRIHALHALDGLAALDAADLLPRLADEHPRVRQQAVRLAEKLADKAPELSDKLATLVNDPALVVRYQLAFSAGVLPAGQQTKILAAIARRDAGDKYLRIAILSSLSTGAGSLLAKLAADQTFRDKPAGIELLGLLAAQIGKQQRTEDVTLLLQVLPELTQQAPPVMQAIVQRLAAKPESALARQIADVTGGKAEELMRGVVEDALGIAGDNKQPAEARVAAVERLRLGKLMELSSLLTELLAPSQPAELQAAALATLASFDAPAVGPLIVESYAGLSPRLRTQAADLLCSRPAWVAALLEAVEKNVIVARDLEPGRLKLLAENPDETLRNRAAAILKQNQLGQRGEVVAAYKSALTLPGDAVRGKEAFIKVCAACHKVQGLGHEIGPNLAAMRSRGPEAILLNVLDPNREVNPQYLSYLVQLTDGRTLSGMIAGETATSLMLKRADNLTDTILRIDIQRLKSTGQSLMPEGLEKQIDPQKLADLLEYLKSVE